MVFKYRGLYAFNAIIALFVFAEVVIDHTWQGGHWYRLLLSPFTAAVSTFCAFQGYQLARDVEMNRRTRE